MFEGDRGIVAPRAGLHIHAIGRKGDLIDEAGHFKDAYAPRVGDGFLIRPDGYVGAIVGSDELPSLEAYLADVGLGPETTAHA